jgi:hypothetical protein
MYPALILCMQLAGAAAPGTVPLQPAVVGSVRGENAGGTSTEGRNGNAVHNPMRKAPRIAGYTLSPQRPISTQR